MNEAQQQIRNEAKLHPVYVAWKQSPKNDPTTFLNLLDIAQGNHVDHVVYYWICEDNMTILNPEQLNTMHSCRDIAWYCS